MKLEKPKNKLVNLSDIVKNSPNYLKKKSKKT